MPSSGYGNTSKSEDAFGKRYKFLQKLPAGKGTEFFEVWIRQRHYPDFRLRGPAGTLYIEFKGAPRQKWVDTVRGMSHAQKQMYRVVLEKRTTKYQGKLVTQLLSELGIQHSVGTIDPQWLRQVGLDPTKLLNMEVEL